MTRTKTLRGTLLLMASFTLCGYAVAQQPQAQKGAASTITFYETDSFGGRWFSTDKRINNFGRYGFNDRANSVQVRRGRWEVCTAPRFEGRCVILRRGDYPSLRETGLEDRISSARPVQQGNREWNRQGAYNRQATPDRR